MKGGPIISPTHDSPYKEVCCWKSMAQVLRPIEFTLLTIIMLIGIIALATELTEYEEIAKVVVIPSLISAYCSFRI